MTEKTQRPRYSPEVRERAVRMVMEHGREYAPQWAAIVSIAAKIGCAAQMLHNWVAQSERDEGVRAGPTTDERTGRRPMRSQSHGPPGRRLR